MFNIDESLTGNEGRGNEEMMPSKKNVFINQEVQEDGSVAFSERNTSPGPYPTTIPAVLDFDKVPEDWPWPYTEGDFSNGWVPRVAVVVLP